MANKHVLLLQAKADKNKLAEDISVFAAAYAFDYDKIYLDVPVFFNEGEGRTAIDQTLNGIYQSIDSWPSEWLRLYSVEAPFDNLHLPSVLDFVRAASISLTESQHEVVSMKYAKAKDSLGDFDSVFVVSETSKWKQIDSTCKPDETKSRVFHCAYNGICHDKYAASVSGSIETLCNKLDTSRELEAVMPSLYESKKPLFDFSPELYMIVTLAMEQNGEYCVEEIAVDTRENYS